MSKSGFEFFRIAEKFSTELSKASLSFTMKWGGRPFVICGVEF